MNPQLPKRPHGAQGTSTERGGDAVRSDSSNARVDDQTGNGTTSLRASAAAGPKGQTTGEGGDQGNGSRQPLDGAGKNGAGGMERGRNPTELGNGAKTTLDETAGCCLVRTLMLSNVSDRSAVLEVSRKCVGRRRWHRLLGACRVRALQLSVQLKPFRGRCCRGKNMSSFGSA